MKNLRYHFIRLHKVFWQSFASCKLFSVLPKRLLKKRIFFKKRQSVLRKRYRGLFFLVLSNMRNVRDQFIIVHKKVLRKKAIFPVKKNVLAFFSHIIEQDECQGTVYQGPEGHLTKIVQVIRIFPWDLRSPQKQTFQRRLSSRGHKTLAYFFTYYRV